MRDQPPEFANAVLDSLTAHIAVLDADGVIIGVNEPWRRFSEGNQGDTQSYYLGQNYFGICDRAYSCSGDQLALAAIDGLRAVLDRRSESFTLEYPCHSPEQERWFIVRMTACSLGGQSRVVVSHDDITARKQAELSLARTERMTRKILEILPVGVWVADTSGRLMLGNAAGQKIWNGGLQLTLDHFDQFSGTWLSSGKPVAPDEWPAARAIARGETVIEQAIEIECLDGSRKIVLNSAVPLHEPADSISGVVIVDQDISARHQADEELRKAKHAADELNLELQQALRREQLAARTDDLTRLHNRRYFFGTGQRLFEISARYGKPMSAIMLDIDHFKMVNDRFGHDAGDKVLQHVARIASAHVRAVDLLARYGGEEFIVLLPETGTAMAIELAERIRKAIAAQLFDAERRRIAVTISAGIAGIEGSSDTLERMIQRADRALYAAKEAGRNRCLVFDSAAPERPQPTSTVPLRPLLSGNAVR